MLAGAHRILQIVIRRQGAAEPAGTTGKLPSMRQRCAWARSVHRLLEAVSRSYPHPYWDFPPRSRREVIWACRPALLAIAGVLCDQRQPISAAVLRQLRSFLTDPSVSPLFGDDPAAARRAAQQLQRSFTGHPDPWSSPRSVATSWFGLEGLPGRQPRPLVWGGGRPGDRPGSDRHPL